jgi:Na+/melibiose symporter-like transporter
MDTSKEVSQSQKSLPLWSKLMYGLAEFGIYLVTNVQGFFLLDFFLEVADLPPYQVIHQSRTNS